MNLATRPNETADGQLVVVSRHPFAGAITVSRTGANNTHAEAGSSCVSQRRAIDEIEFGEARAPFMRFKDSIRIEARVSGELPFLDQHRG